MLHESCQLQLEIVLAAIGMNALVPPYVIRFHETSRIPNDITEDLLLVRQTIADARLDQQITTEIDTDVAVEIIER